MQRTSAYVEKKPSASAPMREVLKIEGREWWLWRFAVTVTIVLAVGLVALTIPASPLLDQDWLDLKEWVRGLAALVLIFDIYTVYQHWQLHRIRRRLVEQDQLFRLISENAADMIALVDRDGPSPLQQPAYQTVLGYSAEELSSTSYRSRSILMIASASWKRQGRPTLLDTVNASSIVCGTMMVPGEFWNQPRIPFAIGTAKPTAL
jgi:PAS domain-containing protein